MTINEDHGRIAVGEHGVRYWWCPVLSGAGELRRQSVACSAVLPRVVQY